MRNKIVYILLLILMCFASAFSQVLLKKASQKEYKSFIEQYMNLFVVIGYSLYIIVLIVNAYILKFIPLSVQSSISESLPLILSLISGRIFFNERITKQKIIGGIFILLGIITIIVF